MALNLENPFRKQEVDPIENLFQIETEFMASRGFFQTQKEATLRRSAARLFLTLSKADGFEYDHFVPFLALSYHDRCFSWPPFPLRQSYALICVCCLILAWKMRKRTFSVASFLRTINVDSAVWSLELIKSVECEILFKLSWRMRSITAVCFLDFFISLLNITDPREATSFKIRTLTNHLFYMHFDTLYTDFKPSIIAATAVIAERKKYSTCAASLEHILRCRFVNTDELDSCLEILMEKRHRYPPLDNYPEWLLNPLSSSDSANKGEDDDDDGGSSI